VWDNARGVYSYGGWGKFQWHYVRGISYKVLTFWVVDESCLS